MDPRDAETAVGTAGEHRSAYERAAEDGAADPRCIPQPLDGEPPIGAAIAAPERDAQELAVWRELLERQLALLPGRAAADYLRGIELLGLVPERFPRLAECSAALERATGWRVARIPGLLHERDFFSLLARRILPSTDYIREPHELAYTPAPDCFHDILGHMPLLTQGDFADFYQQFGRAALRAEGAQRIALERLHWFTVEFGLIREDGERRIFGAGICSSPEEVVHALGDTVEVLPFDADRIAAQDYDVWHLQERLFELASYQQLKDGFFAWCREQGLVDGE